MTLFCDIFLVCWVDSGCGWLVLASIFYKTSYLLLKGLVSHTTKETTRVATVPKLIIDCSVTIEGRLWPLVELTYSGFPHLGCAFWFLIPAGTNLIFSSTWFRQIPAGFWQGMLEYDHSSATVHLISIYYRVWCKPGWDTLWHRHVRLMRHKSKTTQKAQIT